MLGTHRKGALRRAFCSHRIEEVDSLRTPQAQKVGESAVLTPAWCPLGVHDWQEPGRL